MPLSGPTLDGFLDELEKISASWGRMHIPKEREGRRSMSVTTLLKKDKAGKLLKKHADSAGSPQDVRGDSVDDPGGARPRKRLGDVPTKGPGNIPETEKEGAAFKLALVQGENTQTPPMNSGEPPPSMAYAEGKTPKKKGDVPSREDINTVNKYDQRDNATTVTGLGQSSIGIGAFNSPAEHS